MRSRKVSRRRLGSLAAGAAAVAGFPAIVRAADPVRIGFLGPLSGALAFVGQTNQNCLNLAVSEINEQGGILGRKVEVVAEEWVLSVKAERPFERKANAAYHRLEGTYGTFVRSFNVPSTYDLSKVQARFRHGVLHLLVPRAEATKPKKIQVQVE